MLFKGFTMSARVVLPQMPSSCSQHWPTKDVSVALSQSKESANTLLPPLTSWWCTSAVALGTERRLCLKLSHLPKISNWWWLIDVDSVYIVSIYSIYIYIIYIAVILKTLFPYDSSHDMFSGAGHLWQIESSTSFNQIIWGRFFFFDENLPPWKMTGAFPLFVEVLDQCWYYYSLVAWNRFCRLKKWGPKTSPFLGQNGLLVEPLILLVSFWPKTLAFFCGKAGSPQRDAAGIATVNGFAEPRLYAAFKGLLGACTRWVGDAFLTLKP